MSRYQSRQEILDEITHLESKAKHAKTFSDDESYPKSSRDRFFKKYYEYISLIKELKNNLKELDSKESYKDYIDEVEISSIEDEYEEEQQNERGSENDYEEDSYDDEDDYYEDYREEIDFSDSRRALDVFNSLYPEGLDD